MERNTNNEAIIGASVERNGLTELKADPVVTKAEIVRIVHYFIILYNTFSHMNLNLILNLIKFFKRLLTLV